MSTTPADTSVTPLRALMNAWLFAPSRGKKLAVVALLVFLIVNLFWQGAQPYAGKLFVPPWDKLAHFVVYGGFAGLFWILGAPERGHWAVLPVAVLGVLDEVAQSFSPGRVVSAGDWATDVLAALVAVLVLRALQKRLGAGPQIGRTVAGPAA